MRPYPGLPYCLNIQKGPSSTGQSGMFKGVVTAMFERANGQQDVHFPSMKASTKYNAART